MEFSKVDEKDKEEALQIGEDSICQIKYEKMVNDKLEKINGSGFFLEYSDDFIPFRKSLITSYSILNEEYLKENKSIKIIYKNEEKILEMKKDRKVISNKELGYTCIEIFKEDDFEDMLEIDDDIFNKERNYFNNKEIFIAQYSQNDNLTVSSGKILSSEENKMTHNCPVAEDSLGLPLLSRESYLVVIGMQRGYDEENKYYISTPIVDIINNIKYTFCPLSLSEEIKKKSFLQKEIIKILKYFRKFDENSILSINSLKFNKTIPYLSLTLAKHLDMNEFDDEFQIEIINNLTKSTTIIFDSNKDDDSLINLITKVYGKSNLVFFANFSTFDLKREKDVRSINSIYLNGKIEYTKNTFDFTNNNLLLYGNYRDIEEDEYDYTSFQAQNGSIYMKNKNGIIYAALYRKVDDEIRVNTMVKIPNNFIKNKIQFINLMDTIEQKEVNDFFENIDGWFEKCEDSMKQDINFKEFLIYQIEI